VAAFSITDVFASVYNDESRRPRGQFYDWSTWWRFRERTLGDTILMNVERTAGSPAVAEWLQLRKHGCSTNDLS